MKFRIWSLLLIYELVGASLSLTGCGGINRVGKAAPSTASVEQSSLIKGCPGIATNQTDSFLGRWTAGPVRVALQQGVFTPAEEAEIVAALKAWNNHYVAVKGGPFFDYGSDGNPYKTQAMPASNFCQTSMFGNDGKLYGSVAIYKSTTGGVNAGLFASNPSAMAITTTCTVEGGTTPKPFNNAMISVNYINFFNPSKMPDLQTIIGHELGHLNGLDHSCAAGNGTAGFIGCNGTLPDSYKSALMFPVFNFTGVNGERRRNLRENDQSRTNCLYI